MCITVVCFYGTSFTKLLNFITTNNCIITSTFPFINKAYLQDV